MPFSVTPLSNVGSMSANGNVMAVTVNGSLCGSAASQYPNEPCTSVTICSPSNPSKCQTINNMLLDTGSYGIRIFASVLTVPLAPIKNGSQSLAECVQFGDGSSEWGPVETAYVQLGGEPAVSMPIHVVSSTYATPPGICSSSQSTPDTGPEQAGFNGIIGVGLFAQDCGAECVSDPNNSQYFTCNGTDCACGATVALTAQVQNPVALLPVDNNGVMLALPAISSATGATSVNGSLYLGIGTQSNNSPTGAQLYAANANGNIETVFSAYSALAMPSFIDSGTNSLIFPAPTGGLLTDCSVAHGAAWAAFYCPSSVVNLTAVNFGTSAGAVSGTVSFQIGNGYSLLTSSNSVFNNTGSNTSTSQAVSASSAFFDWGLPFFFGKNVFVGIEGASSTLGTGPYWAY